MDELRFEERPLVRRVIAAITAVEAGIEDFDPFEGMTPDEIRTFAEATIKMLWGAMSAVSKYSGMDTLDFIQFLGNQIAVDGPGQD